MPSKNKLALRYPKTIPEARRLELKRMIEDAQKTQKCHPESSQIWEQARSVIESAQRELEGDDEAEDKFYIF